MSRPEPTNTPVKPQRWAPWWVYAVSIAGANYVRQVVVPTGDTVIDVSLFAAVAVVVAVMVTLVFRATRGR